MSEEKRLDRIEAKVDKILEHQAESSATLAAQHVSLSEHIRRTRLLEDKLEPVENHVNMVQGGLKLVGGLILLATGVEGIVALLEYLRK